GPDRGSFPNPLIEVFSMSSHLQKRSSRTNGRKSHGPVTTVGRHNSDQVRISHGLTAKTLVIPGHDPEKAAQLAQSTFDEVQPIGALENELCEAVVSACNLRRRCDRALTGTLTEQVQNALDDIDRLIEEDVARCHALYRERKFIEAVEGLRQTSSGC